ncbi:MAG TPA: glycine cleavage system aminomethyltransferase GcvT [Verrucomicrobiae bacterium]|nr:glycine cleavage system aminomethyltransferase GcvT [Verrucomicrobiae bacterium]
MNELKKTVLHDAHAALGALMAPFGGWSMPIQYEGILAEHRACRGGAALFDICHMGEFLFRGDLAALDPVFSFPPSSVAVGRSRYGFLLNETGGIIDDLIIFRIGEQEAMVVVNAATIDNDYAVISSRLPQGADFTDISRATGKLDLQGPLSREVLAAAAGEQVRELRYFRFLKTEIAGAPAIISRTGYTGELGYEIFLPTDRTPELWERLLADPRVKPAGLGARDVLRLEAGYSLYGSDIDASTSPLEAGLEKFVDLAGDFTGKQALLRQREQGVPCSKIAFRASSRRSPRHGYEIRLGGRRAGEVTSGVFSPVLACGIGMGYVEGEAPATGTAIEVCHEGVTIAATVCDLPFHLGSSLRS